MPNRAPLISVSATFVPAHGSIFVPADQLFSVSDPDGDLITRYRFFDDTVGNGRFRLNGVDQVEDANIEIDASALTNIGFRPGASGSDLLWVQAYDGSLWSAWKSFTITAPPNIAPFVSIPIANMTPAHGSTTIAASSLFNTSDPDGDAIQSYEFWDSGLDPNSGRFVLSGVTQATNAAIPVTAADL